MISPSCVDSAQAGNFAVAVACFWRKDFMKSDLLPVAMMGMASLCTSKSFLMVAWPSSEIAAYLVGLSWGRVRAGAWKNLPMVAVHVLFHVLRNHMQFTFVQFGWIASAAAAIQLVRRPAALKAKLRSVRIASGPLYMFSAIGAFGSKLEADCVTASLAVVGITMILLAAILLRPDNHGLDFVLALPTKMKAMCHGILMVASLTMLTLLLWREGCSAFVLNLLSLILELNRRAQGTARGRSILMVASLTMLTLLL